MLIRKQAIAARLVVVALIWVTLVIYMPPFIRSFVGDDYIQFDYVKPFLAEPTSIWRVFGPTAVAWYYRPLQNVWFWANQLVLGWEPTGYYVVLLWLHALAVALLYRVGRQFGLGQLAAIATAVLFAIHSHWVDVVTWISCVAIVLGAIFSLWGISAMLSYLARPSVKRLGLVLGINLLAFLTHEEALWLPPFLFLLLLMYRWRPNRRTKGRFVWPKWGKLLERSELFLFGGLFLIMVLYMVVQFVRPNPTVQASERPLAEWLAYLQWGQVAEFIRVSSYRFTFMAPLLRLTGGWLSMFAAAWLVGMAYWFWRGDKVVRFGLLWLLAHLLFIYWALWSQLPNLYAGRHIYQASFGLALAIGGTITAVGQWAMRRWPSGGHSWYQQRQTQLAIGLVLLLTAVSWHHWREIQPIQQSWLANVNEEEVAKVQLQALYPSLSPDNHLFSYRFPILPDFTRSVMQVWYDVWLARPGGSLYHLALHGQATPDFIVLDYADGQVYNLMPELADAPATFFLWVDQWEQMTVVQKQLALPLPTEAHEWTGQTYRVQVPADTVLQTAVYTEAGVGYQILLAEEGQTPTAVFEWLPTEAEGAAAEWHNIRLPLQAYADKTVTIRLQATAVAEAQTAYFANPRLQFAH